MKKLIAGLLLIAVLLVLGCSADDRASQDKPQADGEFNVIDYDAMPGNLGMRRTMAETSDSIYVVTDGVVWVSDKTTKCFMPLCPRPECKHNDGNCSAYIGSDGISLYGRWLYYLNNDTIEAGEAGVPELWRMGLDGTAHEKVSDIPIPIEKKERGLYALFTHAIVSNKYLIIETCAVKQAPGIDGEDEAPIIKYYSLDLESMGYAQLDVNSVYGLSPQSFLAFAGTGSMIYGELFYLDCPYEPYVIVEIDLSSGAVRTLACRTDEVDYGSRCYYLSDGILYFVEVDFDKPLYERSRTLYGLNVETCELQEMRREPNSEATWMTFDKNAGYNYALVLLAEDPADRGIYVNDLELNQIEFLPLDELPEEMNGKLIIDFISHDYIFVTGPRSVHGSEAYYQFSNIPLWYLDKSEIGTGAMQWHRWEPEE